MKLSDIREIEKGVYEVEEGNDQWDRTNIETVVILFAGIEAELIPREFDEKDDVL